MVRVRTATASQIVTPTPSSRNSNHCWLVFFVCYTLYCFLPIHLLFYFSISLFLFIYLLTFVPSHAFPHHSFLPLFYTLVPNQRVPQANPTMFTINTPSISVHSFLALRKFPHALLTAPTTQQPHFPHYFLLLFSF